MTVPKPEELRSAERFAAYISDVFQPFRCVLSGRETSYLSRLVVHLGDPASQQELQSTLAGVLKAIADSGWTLVGLTWTPDGDMCARLRCWKLEFVQPRVLEEQG